MIYSISILLYFATTMSIPKVSAFFRLGTSVLVQERLDPIRAPNGFSAHAHTVMGGYNFGLETTYESLQASKCTSTGVKEDKSAYWTPMVYFHHKNGSFIAPDAKNQGMSVYYGFSTGQDYVEFPKGFRLIAGNSFARTYEAPENAKQYLEFECIGAEPGKTTDGGFPKVQCPDKSRLNVYFPVCGNGEADSEDHQSHVKYAVDGKCSDPNFPHHYPELHYELWWSNTEDPQNGIIWNDAADPKQPFVLSNGDATGFSFHGDFASGWDVGVLQKALNDCTGESADGNVAAGGSDTCKHFTMVDAASCKKEGDSPDLPSPETIYGWLPALPGCNPLTTTEEESRANAAEPCDADKGATGQASKASTAIATAGTGMPANTAETADAGATRRWRRERRIARSGHSDTAGRSFNGGDV